MLACTGWLIGPASCVGQHDHVLMDKAPFHVCEETPGKIAHNHMASKELYQWFHKVDALVAETVMLLAIKPIFSFAVNNTIHHSKQEMLVFQNFN